MAGLPGADPDELEVQARRLTAAAAAVDRQRQRLEAAGRAARWRGPAAAAFSTALGEDVARLRGAADRLGDAAAALHAHAVTVRARLASLAAAREAAEGAATRALEDVVELVRR